MYLDPGFGGMLIQIIVAIVAMSGTLIFIFKKKIREIFKKNIHNKVNDAPNVNILDDDVIDVLTETYSSDYIEERNDEEANLLL